MELVSINSVLHQEFWLLSLSFKAEGALPHSSRIFPKHTASFTLPSLGASLWPGPSPALHRGSEEIRREEATSPGQLERPWAKGKNPEPLRSSDAVGGQGQDFSPAPSFLSSKTFLH